MNRFYDFIEGLWSSLDILFQEDAIISHQFVFRELNPKSKKPDKLALWIKNKEKYFFPVTKKQTELVVDVLHRFPGLINHEKEIDEADPWLIALVLEKRESSDMFKDYSSLAIVSTESEKSTTKIPAVCKHFDVRHMNLKEFFDDNKWKFKLEKSL
jgi:hypothetical protein